MVVLHVGGVHFFMSEVPLYISQGTSLTRCVQSVNGRWHVLTIQDAPPIQTLRSCQNHFLWTRHPCTREGYLAHPWKERHPIRAELGAVSTFNEIMEHSERLRDACSCIMITPAGPESVSVGSFGPAKTSRIQGYLAHKKTPNPP